MSKSKDNEFETYYIPPNFIEGSTLFGGLFKLRNAIEAGVLVVAVGLPVFLLNIPLTTKIIVLCLTALPLALLGLFGVSGECLSSFIFAFFKWLKNRRVVGVVPEKEAAEKPIKKEKPVRKAVREENKPQDKEPSMMAEIVGVIRKRSAKKEKPAKEVKPRQQEQRPEKVRPRRQQHEREFLNPVAAYLPIDKIENGVIYTKDHRYVKVLEVEPINFLLRSAREQRSIIYSFISYLKISPVKIQFKVLTKRADINRHTDIVRREMEQETDPHCRMLQEDYLKLVGRIGSREATTRRFFVMLLADLYIVPVSDSILLRLCSFFRLCVFGGVPYAAAKRILKRDKRTEDEKKVMHLANQTILSTAEIIKCFQRKKLDFCCEEELLDELYGDDVTTSDNMAFMVQYLPECRPVILSVANLYLRRQIIFERI